jgi:hypothetical protein
MRNLIRHEAVNSGHIASVGHDPIDRVLEIKFQNGSVYRYHGVSVQEYQGLMNAGSQGEYFHANIKPFYPAERVK